MDNEPNRSDHSEDEYHFAEESPPSFAATTATTQAAGPARKRKTFLILMGLAILILSVYKLLDILFTERAGTRTSATVTTVSTATPNLSQDSREINSSVPSAQIGAPTPAATTTTTTTQTQQSLPATPIPEQTQAPVMNAAVEDRLNSLERQSTATQASLDRLSGQISDMQSALTTLESRLSSINDAVTDVTAKMEEQQQMRLVAKQVKKRKCCANGARPQLKPIFFVRSMVQGRAWLVTDRGDTVTVGVGDDLPGYGIVNIINVPQGTITTSSGAIIGYSPDDS